MAENKITRESLKIGMKVEINPQFDKSRTQLVSGEIQDILTNSETHPHGILVKLDSGETGRVKSILEVGECGEISKGISELRLAKLRSIEEILENGESHFSEFKTSSLWSQNLNKEEIDKRNLNQYGQNTSKVIIAKSIAGFLNADGGDILVGVKESKESDEIDVIGIDSEIPKLKDKTQDGYRRMILDFILKKYFPDIVMNRINDYLRIIFEEVGGKTICRLNISPSDRRIFLKLNNEDVFMVRIDASTRQLLGEAMVEYCEVRFK